MKLEQIKIAWKKQEPISYSADEFVSIYNIKKNHSLRSVKVMLTWDLVVAIVLTISFIITLQVLNLRTSNFWSICLGILGLQHIILYAFQDYLIKKASIFSENVSLSFKSSIKRIKKLLWVYRIWPATLASILFTVYTVRFSPDIEIPTLVVMGSSIAASTALLSYFISGLMLKKQYNRLRDLRVGYESNSE